MPAAIGNYIFAPNEAWYNGSFACGQCVEVIGPKGAPHIFMVADLCPIQGNEQWCSGDMPHFDMNDQVQSTMAESDWGVFIHNWRYVSCPVSSGMNVRVVNVNNNFLDLAIMNHKVGVQGVAKKEANETSFTTLTRTSYNTWKINSPGQYTKYPVTLKVTSIFGEAKEFDLVGPKPSQNYVWTSVQQFSDPSPQNNEAGCAYPYKLVIYDDALNAPAAQNHRTASDWTSGGATVNWQSSGAYNGLYCISATVNSYQEWWFATQGSIPLANADFTGISFFAKASTNFSKLQLFVENSYPTYVIEVGQITTAWQNFTFPRSAWSSLPAGGITRIAFKNNQGSTTPTLYIDDFRLLSNRTTSVLPPNPPSGTPGTPSATGTPGATPGGTPGEVPGTASAQALVSFLVAALAIATWLF